MKKKVAVPTPAKSRKHDPSITAINRADRINRDAQAKAKAALKQVSHARAARRAAARIEETAHLIKACSGEIIDAFTPVAIRLSEKVRLEAIAREIGGLIKHKHQH